MAHLIRTVDLNQVEKALFKHMNDLRMETLFCDVRFNVNGTIIPCHRLVLSAISPYFKTMFNGNFKESNSDTVTMNDIETETFEEILNAMYTASISFHPGNAYFILKASHLFQLEMIENACVSYIMEYPEINFLIETCVFARNIQLDKLYSSCSQTIASSIIEYGKTNSFKKIPVDIFEKILIDFLRINIKESEEEPVLLLIMKWSKHNDASREDIERFLDAAYLKSTKLISSSVMSQLLVSSDDKPINDASEGISELHDNDFNLPLNLYLNAIDVETGQKGWGVLKLNSDLDKHVLSSFHPTSAWRKKVCRVGTKVYCFEILVNSDGDEEVTNFLLYDEKDGTRMHLSALPVPESPNFSIDEFEITAVETSIYLMIKKPFFSIWLYNCESNTWNDVVSENYHNKIYCNVSACTFLDGSFYILAQEKKTTESCPGEPIDYIFSITCSTLILKKLTKVPLRFNGNLCSYFCAFDNRLVISAVYGTRRRYEKNTLFIFDLASSQWLISMEKMRRWHLNFYLFHFNGSLHVVENDRAMVPNEKYDLSSCKWTDLPNLPKQVTISNTNRVLATGEVFGADVNQ
ncbi:kelch-like protein 24a [Planococcus citri]|uniref:kelch-like protein 24a n=1 Tax=Planococcus citri TaxID=170843 RepID=UPI0031F84EDD